MDTATHEQDWQDILAGRRGDEAAYARLVRRYESAIFRQMHRYTRDGNVLRELVQQVFVEAYRGLPRYEPKAPFLHWLRRIATRVGYRHWKVLRREQERTVPLALHHESLFAVAPEDRAPSEAAEQLFLLLEQLSPEDRLVLTLHYFEDCDMAMIAERMGWPLTLVKVRAFRARRRLKALLEAAGFRRQ